MILLTSVLGALALALCVSELWAVFGLKKPAVWKHCWQSALFLFALFLVLAAWRHYAFDPPTLRYRDSSGEVFTAKDVPANRKALKEQGFVVVE